MRKRYPIIFIVIFIIFISACDLKKPLELLISFNEQEIVIRENEQIVIPIEVKNILYEEIFFEYNEKIIKLENDIITGISSGDTILKAFYKDDLSINASIKVVVLEKKDIEFSQNQLVIPKNLQTTLPLILTNLTLEDLDFSYSIPGIVEIIDNKITCLKTGEVIVTIFYKEDITIRNDIQITVLEEHKISFSDDGVMLMEGYVTFLPLILTNISIDDIIIETNVDNIIGIIISGNVIIICGLEVGEVILTVKSKIYDLSSEITIIVQKEKIIEFKYNLNMKINSEVELPITLINIDIEDIIFEFTNNSFEINQITIKALKAGNYQVIARYRHNEDIYASLNIKVEDYTINDVEYWIERLNNNPQEIIFDQNQIEAYNTNITNYYTDTKVVNLLNHPLTITGTNVKNMISSYNNMYSYNIYAPGNVNVNHERESILENRNLNLVPTIVSVQYAIVTDFLSLRSYPTNYYSNHLTTDRFQETGLNVGEGVIIYHTSLDGNWHFVQAQNYNGWIERSKVALCTKQEFDTFLGIDDFILVTADYIRIENVIVRMGQRFPIIRENEDSYDISFPIRNVNGNLYLKEIRMSKQEDIHKGYLPYTTANVFIQAFKLIGIPYSWGDKNPYGRDCSSTMNAIYVCFGFMMPRNTSNQNRINGYSSAVSGVTSTYLKENLKPGSLIFSSGHVLMFIGSDINGVAYVLHNTSLEPSGCRIQPFSTYSSSIIRTLKLY